MLLHQLLFAGVVLLCCRLNLGAPQVGACSGAARITLRLQECDSLSFLDFLSFFQVSAADMNNIMPRLDLTDSVSIIFSLILLQARAEAGGPAEEGDAPRMCAQELGEGSQAGLRHSPPQLSLSISRENCHL